ncbi:MAG: hypothetical protein HWN67_22910 [Candidatus Helarchaeota archaeon]|nr:hypothetical protein [Candidatus Helarchaeota archaeon]
MINIDFDKIKEILKNRWNFLIFIVFIKAIILLIYLLIDYQYFLRGTCSFADHLYFVEFGVPISNGYFPSSQKTLGQPLIMAPFFYIFKPSFAGPLYEPMKFIIYLNVLDYTSNYAVAYLVGFLIPLIPVAQSILLPWAIFNGLILGSLATLSLYKIVDYMFENEEIALYSALIFCFYPFIFIFSFPKFIHNIGFLELSDFTSLAFVLFSIYFFLKIEKNEKNDEITPYFNYILLAIFSGFAILIRISNLLILISFIIFILLSEKFFTYLNDFRQESNFITSFLKSIYDIIKEKKKYMITILIIGILISFQLLYNMIHFGSFLTFGYTWYYEHFYRFQWLIPEFQGAGLDYAILTPNGYFSITYVLNSLLAIISGFFIEIIISIVGIIFLIYRRERILPFLISWLLLFVFFYSFQGFTQLEIVAIRFLMPIIPVFCILIGIVLFVLINRNFDWIKEKT